MKILGHTHFVTTKPIFIAQQGSNMSADCTTVWRVILTTCLELHHYYHQPLSYVNQCISMAKQFSSTAFYIITLTIWGGRNPRNPSSRSVPE